MTPADPSAPNAPEPSPATIDRLREHAADLGVGLDETAARALAGTVVQSEYASLLALLRRTVVFALDRLGQAVAAPSAGRSDAQPDASPVAADSRDAVRRVPEAAEPQRFRQYELAPEATDLTTLVRQRLGGDLPDEPVPVESEEPADTVAGTRPLFGGRRQSPPADAERPPDERRQNERRSGPEEEQRPIFRRPRGR